MRKFSKDQRGVAHLGLTILIIVIVAAVGYAGYRVTQKDKDNKAARSANSATEADCLKVYDDEVLCRFAAQNADISSVAYTAVDKSADAQGQTTQLTFKSDGKGNSSISSKSGNEDYDSITIGGTVYVQQNSGTWIRYATNAPAPTTSVASQLKAAFSNPGTPKDQQIQYKSLGREKCAGGTCYKYQVIDPMHPGTTTHAWINTDSYRLVRLATKSGNGTNDFSITYGPVSITAPSEAIDAAQATREGIQTDLMQAQQDSSQYSPSY